MSAPAPRPMPLFTQEQRARLLANGAATLADPSHDPWPVAKLFTPDAAAGRRGLLEMRAFEMPPHWRMSVAQQALLRGLVSTFWQRPTRSG